MTIIRVNLSVILHSLLELISVLLLLWLVHSGNLVRNLLLHAGVESLSGWNALILHVNLILLLSRQHLILRCKHHWLLSIIGLLLILEVVIRGFRMQGYDLH